MEHKRVILKILNQVLKKKLRELIYRFTNMNALATNTKN